MSTVRDPYRRGSAVGRASVHAFHRDAAPARDRPSRWHWLLTVAVLVPLATPLYNRLEPRLFGIPFFYWGQLAGVVFAMLVTVVVHQLTKRRP
jgi:uncharacterized membrane protein